MFDDLSKTLAAILTQPGLPPELAEAQISFDRPVEQFKPQQTTIDLFLYDIRENLQLRSNEPTIEREPSNNTATIRRPPLRVDCTYLVTAWPIVQVEVSLQEHLLLSQIFQVLSRYQTIPEQFLQGSLRGQKPPLPMSLSSVDGLKNPAEFWTALGTPLRAALAVTITISMMPLPSSDLPPTREFLVTKSVTKIEQEQFLVEGEVKDVNYKPLVNTTVKLLELDREAQTKADGYYSFKFISAGNYTLRVQKADGTERSFPITVPPLSGGKYNLRLT